MPTAKRQLSRVTKPKQTSQPKKRPAEQKAKPIRTNSYKWQILLFCIISLGTISSTLYFYNQSRKNEQLLKEQSSKQQISEVSSIVENIGRHILLPEGEEPTIATVKDKSKLAHQPFFDQSEEGDKLIVYPVSRRAILYRPSLDRIIEMSALSTDEPAPAENPEAQPPSPSGVTPDNP